MTVVVNGVPQLTSYVYDAHESLRHVQLPSGVTIDYIVDGESRRIWKKRNGVLEQGLLYSDDLRPVAKLDGQGNVVARFIYGRHRNVPDAMVKGGQTYRIVTDHLGSPRMVIDATTGAVMQRMDYDEFGRVLVDTSAGFQPFGFAGGIYDRVTGFVRFGARDFDAFAGRWTSKDPLQFGGGDTNLYGYGLGDPVNNIDPQGTWVLPLCLAIAAAAEVAGDAALVAAVVGLGGYLTGATWDDIGSPIPMEFARPRMGSCSCSIRDNYVSDGVSCQELHAKGLCPKVYHGFGLDQASCQADARFKAPDHCKGCVAHCGFRPFTR